MIASATARTARQTASRSGESSSRTGVSSAIITKLARRTASWYEVVKRSLRVRRCRLNIAWSPGSNTGGVPFASPSIARASS